MSEPTEVTTSSTQPHAGRRTLRVAAVQTPAAASVPAGLERATPLVAQAAAAGAELVLLPELMAVHYVFSSTMWDCAESKDGPTVEWLRDVARTMQVYLGTSFLEAEGEDFFNTFVLVGPDGMECGRVRKQTPAMYEPWFFRGEAGSHVIRTAVGTIGVGVCNDNHRSYLPALLQRGDVDLVLMPHCWPLPTRAGGPVSARDIERWHLIQTSLAPLYARMLGVPAVFVNKVGPYATPSPARWLPPSTDMELPGHATIADSDGTVRARMSGEEGAIAATVRLDPAIKVHTPPRTFGGYVYPAGVGGVLVLVPAWIGARAYARSRERRVRARAVSRARAVAPASFSPVETGSGRMRLPGSVA